MIKVKCHCSAVSLNIAADVPLSLTSCNCSICSSYGVLWAYFQPKQIEVIANKSNLVEYSWGDKSLTFVRCKHCGCVSHWRSLDASADRMAVNARLFQGLDFNKLPISHFDGANTWRYLD